MIGTAVYDVSEYAVEAELIRIFSDKKLTFCTAESCTGGMICKRDTAVRTGKYISALRTGYICIFAAPVKQYYSLLFV